MTSAPAMDFLDLVAVSIAIWFGTAVGAFMALWVVSGYAHGRAIKRLERALQREIACGAANENSAKATITRLRTQRNELLAACADARSTLLEVQLEARAREEQIRRQAANSGFGAL